MGYGVQKSGAKGTRNPATVMQRACTRVSACLVNHNFSVSRAANLGKHREEPCLDREPQTTLPQSVPAWRSCAQGADPVRLMILRRSVDNMEELRRERAQASADKRGPRPESAPTENRRFPPAIRRAFQR
jgi:hypothetical protein